MIQLTSESTSIAEMCCFLIENYDAIVKRIGIILYEAFEKEQIKIELLHMECENTQLKLRLKLAEEEIDMLRLKM